MNRITKVIRERNILIFQYEDGKTLKYPFIMARKMTKNEMIESLLFQFIENKEQK